MLARSPSNCTACGKIPYLPETQQKSRKATTLHVGRLKCPAALEHNHALFEKVFRMLTDAGAIVKPPN